MSDEELWTVLFLRMREMTTTMRIILAWIHRIAEEFHYYLDHFYSPLFFLSQSSSPWLVML